MTPAAAEAVATIPIQYFQVTATAIPTLLIAVIVGLRGGDTIGVDADKATTKANVGNMIGAFLIAGGVIAGEFASLIALVQGHSQWFQAILAAAAIAFCLSYLTIEFTNPVTRHLKGFWKNVATLLIIASIVTPVVFVFTSLERYIVK